VIAPALDVQALPTCVRPVHQGKTGKTPQLHLISALVIPDMSKFQILMFAANVQTSFLGV
jgi:hypothetical protein